MWAEFKQVLKMVLVLTYKSPRAVENMYTFYWGKTDIKSMILSVLIKAWQACKREILRPQEIPFHCAQKSTISSLSQNRILFIFMINWLVCMLVGIYIQVFVQFVWLTEKFV